MEILDSNCACLVVHFYVSAAKGVAGLIIHHNANGDDLAKLKKELKEVVGSRFLVEVTNKNVHKSGFNVYNGTVGGYSGGDGN